MFSDDAVKKFRIRICQVQICAIGSALEHSQKFKLYYVPSYDKEQPGVDNDRQQPEFLIKSLCGYIKLGVTCALNMLSAGASLHRHRKLEIIINWTYSNVLRTV